MTNCDYDFYGIAWRHNPLLYRILSGIFFRFIMAFNISKVINCEYFPPNPLNEFVESMYYVKGDMGVSEKDILPDFKTDMIFLFDTKLRGFEGHTSFTIYTGILSGFRREPLHFGYTGNVEMVGIRFLPFGFTQLFGIKQNEISSPLNLTDVLKHREYREITERLSSESEPKRKFNILEGWLLGVLRKTHIVTNLAIIAIHRITSTKGMMPLKLICNNSPSEYKQLQRFCRDTLGIAPKYYSRMLRFEHLHRYIQTNPSPDWMTMVSNFELTDQSHLIREIRHFTGLPPKGFLSRINSFI
jgi:AraC-like DNA-binding protein